LFGGLTFQGKRKAFRLDSKFEKNFKKIGRRKKAGDHHDLLDMLLSAKYEDGSKMDENQLVDEILILFGS
jgi:cytochrome P450